MENTVAAVSPPSRTRTNRKPARRARLGYLGAGDGGPCSVVSAFQRGLGDYGYVPGDNLTVEYRFASGEPARYQVLAEELASLGLDVIVVADSAGIRAAQQAATDIPIVMAVAGDPVADGFVACLEHPGGNITGLTNQARALTRARLELLARLVSGLARVAVLWNADHPLASRSWEAAELSAAALGIGLVSLSVQDLPTIETAFKHASEAGAQAVLVLQDRVTTYHRRDIARLATAHRLPGAYG
jgi:putative tryptophan/tyrosine transport system substrate-binding protein